MSPVAAVKKNKKFKDQVEKAKLKYTRLDAFIDGVVWRLERSPEEGRKVGVPLAEKYRILDIDRPTEEFPQIWILYAVEKSKVVLLEIHFV